ncbi:acyl carrier protein [Nocardia acidivorans]|uniref:acyl carrier protein n=1 Tax=Nocardia acidivorans TaxID=404580 RepID=UPI0008362932|nr:acyl carrier protein [Nocardia acidivorans]
MITIDDLRRILTQSSGEDENIDLSGDILDTSFENLGYDSLALIDTATRIKHEYGIEIDDEAIAIDMTPRTLLDAVARLVRG